MANEFVHGTVGVSMTQAEFEAVGLHVLNSQATGDVIYASSATQLSRLGIGATNAILTVIGGVPTWQTTLSGLTFVAPALGAATATSINGLVITTTAGTLTIANNASAALVTSGNFSITLTATAATNVTLPTTGTLATLAGTEELDSKTLDSSVLKGTFTASGSVVLPAVTVGTLTLNDVMVSLTTGALEFVAKRQNADSPSIVFYTPGVSPGYADTTRLVFTGRAARTLATFSNLDIVFGAAYTQYTEMTAPGAGAADTARIYAVVGGDTLTDLAAVFQDGTVAIFAQEVTEPDSPIFQFPDMTELRLQLRKPDRKTVQFAAIFPDGREFIMNEYRYPTPRWN